MDFSRLILWGTATVVMLLLVVFLSSDSPTEVIPPMATGAKEAMKANRSLPNELTPEVTKHCHILVDGVPLEDGPFHIAVGQVLKVDVDVELQPDMLNDHKAFTHVKLACRAMSNDPDDWSLGKQPEFGVGDNRPQRVQQGDKLVTVPDRKGQATLDLASKGLTGDCKLRVYAVIDDHAIDGRTAQSTFHYLVAEGHIIVGEPATAVVGE